MNLVSRLSYQESLRGQSIFQNFFHVCSRHRVKSQSTTLSAKSATTEFKSAILSKDIF